MVAMSVEEHGVIVNVAVLANDHGWGHMDGWGGGWMWIWGAAMMLLVVLLVVWLVRSIAGSSRPEPTDPSERARSILSERYARGELSTEEYRERLSELQ
jgi:putative membrane protein